VCAPELKRIGGRDHQSALQYRDISSHSLNDVPAYDYTIHADPEGEIRLENKNGVLRHAFGKVHK